MPSRSRQVLFIILVLLAGAAQATNSPNGPPTLDSPVVVDIGFLLSNINDISEDDETYDFEGVLSMRWQDSRLAFDPAVTGYDQRYYQGQFQFNEVFSGWWPQIILANNEA